MGATLDKLPGSIWKPLSPDALSVCTDSFRGRGIPRLLIHLRYCRYYVCVVLRPLPKYLVLLSDNKTDNRDCTGSAGRAGREVGNASQCSRMRSFSCLLTSCEAQSTFVPKLIMW